MSKKKLAFYDAFKQKNTESREDVVDPNTATNISGHTAFTPGEELTLRPQPKHMPTARHNVNLNPTEIRAKGSSIPPGAAEKWQTPNVNKAYIKNDSDHLAKNNYKAQEKTGVREESQPMNTVQNPLPPQAPQQQPLPPEPPIQSVKPISLQSETLPYLDTIDLETQGLQATPQKAGDTSFNKIEDTHGQIILSPVHGLSLLAIFVVSICISFYFGMIFQGNGGQEKDTGGPNLRLTNEGVDKARDDYSSRRRTTDKAVSTKGIRKKKKTIDVTKKKSSSSSKTVDNEKYKYTIRAITAPSGSRVSKIKANLEESGFKFVVSKRTRRGYLISVGAFKTKKDAEKVLKRLVKKVINHSRPFKSAYIVNK